MTQKKTSSSRNCQNSPSSAAHCVAYERAIGARPSQRRADATPATRKNGHSGDCVMNPKISVIIPVYNTGPSAVKLINSLLKNPYKNLEIIAVDDGSTDDSYAKLKNIKDKTIKIFHKENGGASSARNFGLKKATGDYISFLDSDDEIFPEFFTKMIVPLADPENILSVCSIRYKRLKQGTTKDAYVNMLEPRQAEESFKCYILRLLASDGRLYSVFNKLYHANIIKRNNLKFDETLNFAEDTKFVLDYLAAAEKSDSERLGISFILRPLYIYNYGTATSTIVNSALDWKNWQTSFINLKTWLGPHPEISEKYQLTRVHRRWQISHALAVARSNKPFSEKSKYLNPLLLPIFTLLAKIRK